MSTADKPRERPKKQESPDFSMDRRELFRAAGGTVGVAAVVGGGFLGSALSPVPAFGQRGPEIPNFDEDPPYIEGVNGGPATPFGGHPSAGHDGVKDDTGDVAGFLDQVGNIATTVGKILTLTGVGGGLGGSLVTAGNVIQVGASVLELITGDPPKPHEQIVSFEQRVSAPPIAGHPAGKSVAVLTQSAVFTVVTARGLLDAMERTGGALEAGDRDWVFAHSGAFLAAREQLARDLATVGAAAQSVATAVRGTPADVRYDASQRAEVRAWLNDPRTAAEVVRAGREAGLKDGEIREGLARSTGSSGLQGLPSAPTLLSQGLNAQARQLYGRAVEMHVKALDVCGGA